MINYTTKNKLLSYLPKKQINPNIRVLLHLRSHDGDNYYCFFIDKNFDTVFLYFVPSIINSNILFDELGYCPINALIDNKTYIIKNSKMIGKTYKGVYNEHFNQNKK